MIGRARAAGLLLVSALGLGACSDDAAAGGECACPEDQCPAELCNLAMEIPASCAPEAGRVELHVDGAQTDTLEAGHTGPACHATIAAAGEATIELVTANDAFLGLSGTASCSAGGETALSPFCTLRFELAESCRGRLTEPAADVVVDGREVGQVAVDNPLVPCVLVGAGAQVSGTIRAGTEAVLTAPLTCHLGGSQPSLIMECAP